MPGRKSRPEDRLTRRERQIVDALFELGKGSAEQIRERLPDPPSNSAVRAMLARLEEKGAIRREAEELRYVYFPTISRAKATKSAMERLVDVFFEGSVAKTVTALVELQGDELTEAERDRLSLLIRSSRRDEKDASDE